MNPPMVTEVTMPKSQRMIRTAAIVKSILISPFIPYRLWQAFIKETGEKYGLRSFVDIRTTGHIINGRSQAVCTHVSARRHMKIHIALPVVMRRAGYSDPVQFFGLSDLPMAI